jgi:hypothetical protein
MAKKLSESAANAGTQRIFIAAPSVAPFAARHPIPAKSRPILLDAMACFLATAMGSLAPQAVTLFDPAPRKPLVGAVDSASGKFVDRVLIGGLRPLSFEDSKVSPPPAFTIAAPRPDSVLAREEAKLVVRNVAAPAPARAAKELSPRKPEKTAELKPAETMPLAATASAPLAAPLATPLAAPTAAPFPAGAAETNRQREPEEQGALAALTPANLSSKLGPLGQKVIGGAKAIGGAVASGFGWLGY